MAGCGGPERQAVHGTVTLDGTPVDGGTINFLPVDGKPDSVARGDIKAGSYSIPAGQGPVVGAYRIEIRWMRKTGRMVSGFGTQAPEMASVIPDRYNRMSELKADIKPGDNSLDFDLKSK
jgi:hypothetical protein